MWFFWFVLGNIATIATVTAGEAFTIKTAQFYRHEKSNALSQWEYKVHTDTKRLGDTERKFLPLTRYDYVFLFLSTFSLYMLKNDSLICELHQTLSSKWKWINIKSKEDAYIHNGI